MRLSCSFGRYCYIRLLLGVALAGDMFQKKIGELFNDILNVFGIADGILIAGFDVDGRNYGVRLQQVLWRCMQTNLKLNKEKCLFRYTCTPIFCKVISRHRMSPDPAKVKMLMDMLLPNTKRELQLFPGIVNYLSKFSPMASEVCEPLRRLTSVNAVWNLNKSFQKNMKNLNHSWRKTHAWNTKMSESCYMWKLMHLE